MLQTVFWRGAKGCKKGGTALIIFPQLFISPQTQHLAIFRTDSHMIPKQNQRLEGGKRSYLKVKMESNMQLERREKKPYLGFPEPQVIWGT